MRKLLSIFPVLMMLTGFLLLFQRPAYGYTDPGTGLLAVQAAGSAIVAAGWYLRRKIYALFHRSAAATDDSQDFSAGKDDKESTPR